MRDESSSLDCPDVLVQLHEVREQSRQLCEESRLLCTESQHQRHRSPWPHPVSSVEPLDSIAPLADQPAEQPANDARVSQQDHPNEAPAQTETLQSRGKEHAFTEQQILDLMALVLDHLPLEQQLQIIKALCTRTMAVTRARLDTKLVHSA